jgi:thiamine-phosphate pyrophosphorylase
MSIKNARKIIGKKIIGVTCHNSIKLAKAAIKEKLIILLLVLSFLLKPKK